MYRILHREDLAPGIARLRLAAPLVAHRAQAGQFCIVRPTPDGERLPLTLAGWDAAEGWIEIIFMAIGESTLSLLALHEGGAVADVAGPLGQPSHLSAGRVVCVGGGVGTAVLLSQVRAMAQMGAKIDVIIGARNREMVICEKDLAPLAHALIICTDDGSYGRKGFVTAALAECLENTKYDMCLAIGPVRMMQAVAELTRPVGLYTQVSLNPIMIDGTGMCGGCRVQVGGQTKYACVDGPDFDGHQVDFDMLASRLGAYRTFEGERLETHKCRSGIHG